MEFPFGRQSSKDFIFSKTGALRSSLNDSVKKANGLIGGISSKFDQVVNIVGGPEDEEEVSESSGRRSGAERRRTGSTGGASSGRTSASTSPGSTARPSPGASVTHSPTGRGGVGATAGARSGGGTSALPPSASGQSTKRQPLVSQESLNKPKPSRPPPPRQGSRTSIHNGVEGTDKGPGSPRFKRQQSAPVGYEPSGESTAIGGGFNESHYGGTASQSPGYAAGGISGRRSSGAEFVDSLMNSIKSPSASSNTPEFQSNIPAAPLTSTTAAQPQVPVAREKPPFRRRNTNPFLEDSFEDTTTSAMEPAATTVVTRAEVHSGAQYGSQSDAYAQSRGQSTVQASSGYMPSTNLPPAPPRRGQELLQKDEVFMYGGSPPKQRTAEPTYKQHQPAPISTTGTLGSDLLPGIPRVPSGGQGLLAPQQGGKDLLAITPTSGDALPIPDITPTHPAPQHSDQEIYDDSDGSDATEGCDDVADEADLDEDFGCDGAMVHSGSMSSDRSWTSDFSNENMVDDLTRECMEFMKRFVYTVFDTR